MESVEYTIEGHSADVIYVRRDLLISTNEDEDTTSPYRAVRLGDLSQELLTREER